MLLKRSLTFDLLNFLLIDFCFGLVDYIVYLNPVEYNA